MKWLLHILRWPIEYIDEWLMQRHYHRFPPRIIPDDPSPFPEDEDE